MRWERKVGLYRVEEGDLDCYGMCRCNSADESEELGLIQHRP
jgi:hypothetical protein